MNLKIELIFQIKFQDQIEQLIARVNYRQQTILFNSILNILMAAPRYYALLTGKIIGNVLFIAGAVLKPNRYFIFLVTGIMLAHAFTFHFYVHGTHGDNFKAISSDKMKELLELKLEFSHLKMAIGVELLFTIIIKIVSDRALCR